MACSARTAARMEAKPMARFARYGGSGSSLSVASVTTPSKPSEPTNKPVQIEAGFVFVRAAAEPDDGAVGEHDFEAEHVVAGDAVFQAARAAGVGDDVAADEALASGSRGRAGKTSSASRPPPASVAVMTPGCATTTKSPALISLMRFMRSSESTMPPRTGTQPPT